MLNQWVDNWLEKIPFLDTAGHSLSRSVHGAVLRGGEQVRKGVDALHGTWLGHPLHPILIEGVIGAWTFASVFDFISLVSRSKRAESAADTLITLGNIAAVPSILSGLADYSTIPRPAIRAGLAHATINNIGYILQLASAAARKDGKRNSAIGLSGTATVLLVVGAYLGGHLVYSKKVGVKRTESVRDPQDWITVLEVDALEDGEPKRVDVNDNPVLLYRNGERLLAIGAVCPHAGGPLEQGTFFDDCVQCPWHDSVFDLNDGSIVHGPSTYAVPDYEARTHDGSVQVRVAEPTRT